MANKSRRRLVLLVSLSLFCGAVTRLSAQEKWQRLVSPKLLEHANLQMVWQNDLPIKTGESLKQLFVLGDRIYALSDRNYMISLNKDTGKMVFSRSIAPIGFPVAGLELYRDELLSVIGGNMLVDIDPATGSQRSSERLECTASCPPTRNSSFFYIAGTDRRVHVLRVADRVQTFEVAAQNDSIITSIIADEQFAVFATDAGNVISILPDQAVRLWQFDAAGSIAGPLVRNADSLFFASADTNVYRLDISSVLKHKLVWKYQTAAKLDRTPRVTRDVVYQYVSAKGLAAIDKQSGRLLWQLAEGVDLLTEAAGRAYVITNIGTLTVMDNRRAKQLYSVNFAGVSKHVTNVADSTIYVADKRGRVACIRPLQ